MLNPEVLKCHEDLITLDTYVQQGETMDNKFYIYVKTLTSVAKPILLSSYPLTHMYVHVK